MSESFGPPVVNPTTSQPVQVPSTNTVVSVTPTLAEITTAFAMIVQSANGGPMPATLPPAGYHWASVNGNWIMRHNPGTLPTHLKRPTPTSGWVRRKDGSIVLRKQGKKSK